MFRLNRNKQKINRNKPKQTEMKAILKLFKPFKMSSLPCFPYTHMIRYYESGDLSLQGENRAGIFKQSMGARHRARIGLSYRPARLHRLAVPGLHKCLKIRAQVFPPQPITARVHSLAN